MLRIALTGGWMHLWYSLCEQSLLYSDLGAQNMCCFINAEHCNSCLLSRPLREQAGQHKVVIIVRYQGALSEQKCYAPHPIVLSQWYLLRLHSLPDIGIYRISFGLTTGIVNISW